MRYAIDCEFIDIPSCSALISLGVFCEDGRAAYFEFDYPQNQVTPWLRENVIPHLTGTRWEPSAAAERLIDFIGDDKPEFWCYYGAYDWYWFCRLFGGLFSLPDAWPDRYRELADYVNGKPQAEGAQHNALADAKGIMAVVQALAKR